MRVNKEEGLWQRAQESLPVLDDLKGHTLLETWDKPESLELRDPDRQVKALLWNWNAAEGLASIIIDLQKDYFWIEAWTEDKKESFFESSGALKMLDVEDAALCIFETQESFQKGEEAFEQNTLLRQQQEKEALEERFKKSLQRDPNDWRFKKL